MEEIQDCDNCDYFGGCMCDHIDKDGNCLGWKPIDQERVRKFNEWQEKIFKEMGY